jgi:uncharacterized protein (TIGR02266 family)
VGQVTTQGERRAWLVENISGGGAFLRTEEVLPLGALVDVDLLAPGMKRTLRVRGRVVVSVPMLEAALRRTSPGMGIQFEGLTAETAERLQDLLKAFEVRSPASPTVRDVKPAPAAQPDVPLSAIKQRRHRRIPAKHLLGNVQSNGELVGLACPIEDVSVAGLRLEISNPLPVGSAVEIELFRVEHALRVILSGEVVSAVRPEHAAARRTSAGMSVRFSAMTEATLNDLRSLLVDLAPAAAAELQGAAPAEQVLPEELLQGTLESSDITDAVVEARRSHFEQAPADLGASEPETKTEDVREELGRLRREVDARLRRIAELEAGLQNKRR